MKTSRFFCNKQDLSYIHKNGFNSNLNLKSTNSVLNHTHQNNTNDRNINNIIQDENTSSSAKSLKNVPSSPSIIYPSLSFLSPQNKQNHGLEQSKNKIQRQKSECSSDSQNKSASTYRKPPSPSSVHGNNNNNNDNNNQISSSMVSSNAKLPPIRNSKTKLLLKNLQTKRIERQHSVEQNHYNLNSTPSISTEFCDNNNDIQNDIKVDCKLNLNKIIRSSSSSVLEKRFIFQIYKNVVYYLTNNLAIMIFSNLNILLFNLVKLILKISKKKKIFEV
jgi:hypothetical protein